jgi:hypothetical protein
MIQRPPPIRYMVELTRLEYIRLGRKSLDAELPRAEYLKQLITRALMDEIPADMEQGPDPDDYGNPE